MNIEFILLLMFASACLFSVVSVISFRSGQVFPSLVIGLGSFPILFFQLMQKIFPNEMHLGSELTTQATIVMEMSVWQKCSMWYDPIGFVVIAVGCIMLAFRAKRS